MFIGNQSLISKTDLYKTPETDLKRFADYLGLKTQGYSHRQRAKIIYWLITRRYVNPYATR